MPKYQNKGGLILKNLVVIIISALIIVSMVNIKAERQEQNHQAISVGKPIIKNIAETVTIYGTIQEQGRHALYAKSNAIIETVHIAVGDVVQAGDPLVTLRSIDEAANTTVNYTDSRAWVEQLFQSSATTTEEIEYEIQTVFNHFLISQNQLSADLNHGVYTLYSPIDGLIVSVSGKIGDGVTRYFPTVIVTDLDQLVVKSDVSESSLCQIKLGDRCNITIPALGDNSYTGEIEFISPYAHEIDILTGGGTYATEVITGIQNKSNTIRPGYQATIRVNVGEQKNMLLVPYDAIGQGQNGQEYVMVWTGKQAYRKDIIAGKEVGEFVQILSGISEHHQIIRNVNKVNFTESVVLYEAS